MNKILLSLLLVSFVSVITAATNGKISKQLQLDLNAKESVEMYLLLHNKHAIKTLDDSNRIEKLKFVIAQLKDNSKQSQSLMKKQLIKYADDYQFYWINNSVWIKASASNAQKILQQKFIKKAFANTPQKLAIIKDDSAVSKSTSAVGWGSAMINAPAVWALGFRGQNVVIAGQDTGYKWDHIALKEKYAGWNGATVDHNYHWHDAIHLPNIPCVDGQGDPASCDDHGHGTHTMGTMVGDDEVGNQVGVAPDAKWIGCRNMNQGIGTPQTYTECFQFFLEPTDLNGLNPDVTKAPHIINNSWGCPISEGCTQPDALESIVNNVVDAGILVVAAAGNSGSGCGTVKDPIAIYDKTFTVGSTTSTDAISGFSSRGTVIVDGSNRIKPDVSAPGSSILSSLLSGGYGNMSGTSMASPHVAGVAALLISANPSLAGQPEQLKQIILSSSLAKTSSQDCNGIPGTQIPNNTFGWGRLDALAAINQVMLDFVFTNGFE
ncbi:MAG: S8 family serine peptidase [Proteobacteria bacterium]|nr:S8 family serine peptidase [Pseudomonadota bacterium]